MKNHWWKQFYTKHRNKITIFFMGAVFCLGIFFHRLFFHAPERVIPSATETATAPSDEKKTFWTCSMHSNIRKPKPGKCPICGMDLIPVSAGMEKEMASLRQITISKAARELMKIQTIPVERRFVTAEIRMVGKVAYDETRLGYITAWVPGRLDRLYVDYAGVEVNKGDHMVYMYSPELYATQDELIQAVKSVRERKDEVTYFPDVINLIESARERLRLWGMTKEQIREMEQREKPSDNITIHAPMGGIVIEKLRQEGDYVNVGDRIYTVADLSQVWVMLDAYESDLIWLRYGQEITFTTTAYPGERFVGRIAFIEPMLNDKTRTVKVRVNVPNPMGKLKPDMFVHGIVRAKVAAGGRVMDTEMTGKWICPMHPEIVKDSSGVCDSCSMALVRSESLGYASAEDVDRSMPLVIPVSAALVTGTRAIVYVEVPGSELPVFEGREIVLGPRTGDFYTVKNGLQEGEIIVTNGNMKIDSAVQIQAKPSMMTPEGGGDATKKTIDIPPEFQEQLLDLNAAFNKVSQAMKTRNIDQIHRAFTEFGKALNKVNGGLLTGHSNMVWKELSMLLDNDVVEGRDVTQIKEADFVYQLLTSRMKRVQQYFDISHKISATQPEEFMEVPSAFLYQFEKFFAVYSVLHEALAKDNVQDAKRSVLDLQSSLAEINPDVLSETAYSYWEKEFSELTDILNSLKQSNDLVSLRENFSSLSDKLTLLLKSFDIDEIGTVYELHCPMALNGKGAVWLQKDDKVRNPYFGPAMLRCADRVEMISEGTSEEEKEGYHHE